MLRDLSLAECEDLLLSQKVGRLAVRDEDGVYVVPLQYAFADGYIYGHASPGKKIRLMRLWPRVGFQVDMIGQGECWASVLVQGTFYELTSEADRVHARQVLLRAFGGHAGEVTFGHGHRTTLAEAVLFRIVPYEVTGKALGESARV
ncbi:MAG TPA: pyridoxamine 5'-phosphate oxidase family protein [Tepidiformaceae bacterium]|nr:pyridoxamine 5'-phosphate oxidase family protein [Tepidiformaceae bacterium]